MLVLLIFLIKSLNFFFVPHPRFLLPSPRNDERSAKKWFYGFTLKRDIKKRRRIFFPFLNQIKIALAWVRDDKGVECENNEESCNTRRSCLHFKRGYQTDLFMCAKRRNLCVAIKIKIYDRICIHVTTLFPSSLTCWLKAGCVCCCWLIGCCCCCCGGWCCSTGAA